MDTRLTPPNVKTKPHEELLENNHAAPGDGYVALLSFPGHWGLPFRATGAERVEGIDYSAFKIRAIWVGQNRCFYGTAWDEPWPASLLFEKWDVPMETALPGLNITIQFVNTSDQPQPFAVKLVGVLMR